MIVCLLVLAVRFHLSFLSLGGIALVLILLVYEHSLVRAGDLSRVNVAFFTLNGYVSVLFFAFWAADIFLNKKFI